MNTDKRTRILLYVILGGLGLVMFDRVLWKPWWEQWNQLGVQLNRVEQDLESANLTFRRGRRVEEDWKRVEARLKKTRDPDVQTHFISHLGQMWARARVGFDINAGPQPQHGDFREYIYQTKFKLKWEQLVRLLVELHNSEEFLRPMRISIVSRYDREPLLDVDLRVSTIEYVPVNSRNGSK